MHPHLTGELARLRSQQIADDAAARHVHAIRRPASTPAGFLFTVSLRHATRARRAEAGIRERIGIVLIRSGMRVIDPIAHLRTSRSGR